MLTVFLAVVLVVEGVVAGLWYPGFFRQGKESGSINNQNGYGGTSKTARSLSDADYNIEYTDKEIADAPKTEMELSAGNTSASAGGFSVDFGAFNDMEDDTFTIRKLPLHDFKEDGYSVQGYDLSLASGKHSFAGEVCVTYPRTGAEGDLVLFMSKDPDTGENERLYYEISDDGKNYLVYTDHFSPQVMLTKSQIGNKLREDVAGRDVSDPLTRKALSAFFYYDPEAPYVTSEVRYNANDLWKKVKDDTVPMLACEKLDSMVGNPGGFSSSRIPEEYSVLPYIDDDTARKWSANADAVNNGASILSEGIQGLSSGDTADFIRVGSEYLTYFGAVNTVLSFQLNTTKAIEEVEDGKYEDMTAAEWGHFSDNLSTAAGVVGLAGAAIGSAPVTVIAAVAGLGLYALSMSAGSSYEDLDQAELNYRSYFGYSYYAGSVYLDSTNRFFYYDDPQKVSELKSYGNGLDYGVVPRLACLDEKQNELFKKYLGDHSSGLKGEDPRREYSEDDKAWQHGKDGWMTVLKGLYEATKDKPELLYKAIPEFYWNYCNACSPYFRDKNGKKLGTVSEDEYLSLSREAMKRRGAAASAARLPDETEMELFAENYYNELLIYHQQLFKEFAEYLDHQAQLEVDTMIETELVPMLNTPMVFNVEDSSLENGKTFEDSIYNVAPQSIEDHSADGYLYKGRYTDIRQEKMSPMEFCIHNDGDHVPVGPPLFLPAVGGYTADGEDTYRSTSFFTAPDAWYFPVTDNFWPRCAGGNEVYRCTLFHYLMMGAPNSISFYDMDEDERFSDDFEIPVPDENGCITVNVRIAGSNNKTGLDAFLGTWEGSLNTTNKAVTSATLKVKKKKDGDYGFHISYGYTDGHSAEDFRRAIGKNHPDSYRLVGSTLMILPDSDGKGLVDGFDYLRKLDLHGNTITVTRPSSKFDSDVGDWISYTTEYTLTKVSDKVD